MSYTLTQAEYTRLKTRLTTRENRMKRAEQSVFGSVVTNRPDFLIKEARHLINEVKYAMEIFEKHGFPDEWSRWERAESDANLQIRRSRGSLEPAKLEN